MIVTLDSIQEYREYALGEIEKLSGEDKQVAIAEMHREIRLASEYLGRPVDVIPQ